MRLWHKDLIPYLPRQQLIAQWRECCLIATLLAKDHTPNHILVNPIIIYDPAHFISYCSLVYKEAYERGYKINDKSKKKLENDIHAWQIFLKYELPWDLEDRIPLKYDMVFDGWHNDRYLAQCYYNLQEKYDRGAISEEEWQIISDWFVPSKLFMNPPK